LAVLGCLHSGFGGLGEAITCLEESIAIQEAASPSSLASPISLALLGWHHCRQGRAAQGRQYILRGLAIAEELEHARVETCLHYLAQAERGLGDYVAAESAAQRSLRLARELGRREAWCLIVLGDILKEQGRLDEAVSHYRASVSRHPQDSIARHTMEFNIGDVALIRGEYPDAKRHFEVSLAGFVSLGIGWGRLLALDGLAYAACKERDFALARAHFQRACRIGFFAESISLLTNVAAGIALLEARSGHEPRAVELLALVRSHPATEHQTRVRRVEPLWTEMASTLPADEFAAAAARGSGLDLAVALGAFSSEESELVA
jgi:tetratricopeptide (TPR) repeat protein